MALSRKSKAEPKLKVKLHKKSWGLERAIWGSHVPMGLHELPLEEYEAEVEAAIKAKRRNVKAENPRPRQSAYLAKTEHVRKATEYCRWLAARDGVELPPVGCTVQALWIGKRICGVNFGGKVIDIPNWNWTPTVEVLPVRELEDA